MLRYDISEMSVLALVKIIRKSDSFDDIANQILTDIVQQKQSNILTRGLGPERSWNHLFYLDSEVVQHADSDITLYHKTFVISDKDSDK